MAERPQYLNVAQIVTTVGVKGELKVKPLSDDPLRLKELKEVSCLLATGERIVLHPTAVKARPDGVVMPVCTATTDGDGVATCTSEITATVNTLLTNGYDAAFAGDADYLPATDHGKQL